MKYRDMKRSEKLLSDEDYIDSPWESISNSISICFNMKDRLLVIDEDEDKEIDDCVVILRRFSFGENAKKEIGFDASINIIIDKDAHLGYNTELGIIRKRIYMKNLTKNRRSHKSDILYALGDIIRKSNIINMPSLIVELDARFDFVFKNGITVTKDIIYQDN